MKENYNPTLTNYHQLNNKASIVSYMQAALRSGNQRTINRTLITVVKAARKLKSDAPQKGV